MICGFVIKKYLGENVFLFQIKRERNFIFYTIKAKAKGVSKLIVYFAFAKYPVYELIVSCFGCNFFLIKIQI